MASGASNIFESHRFADVVPHFSPRTLLILDLDNNVMEAASTLGSVQWVDRCTSRLVEKGMKPSEAEAIVSEIALKIGPFIQVKLVDPAASTIIAQAHAMGVKVIALTARYVKEAALTSKHLDHLGIDLTDIVGKEIQFDDLEHPALWQKGTLFADFNSKRVALLKLAENVQLTYEKVIFMDDKRKYVDAIGEACSTLKIAQYVGIHFRACDEKVEAFDFQEADRDLLRFQKEFPNVLTEDDITRLTGSNIKADGASKE